MRENYTLVGGANTHTQHLESLCQASVLYSLCGVFQSNINNFADVFNLPSAARTLVGVSHLTAQWQS